MSLKVRRLLAALIDFYILCFASTMLVAVVTLGSLDATLLSISVYLISFFLFAIFKDSVFINRSIGKKILHLKVYSEESDGQVKRMKISTQVKRGITLILVPLELLLTLINDKRLGDMLAKTEVIMC